MAHLLYRPSTLSSVVVLISGRGKNFVVHSIRGSIMNLVRGRE